MFFYLSMTDTLLLQGQRHVLVKQLATQYPFAPEVLQAMDRVPRHFFVEDGLQHLAYKDKPLPIAAKQTISQPYTVAMQTHLLACKKWDKVLEVGTGCGYQTAVLLALNYKVYSIERIRTLFLQAQKNLLAIGFPANGISYGDGFAGLPLFAPFDGILVTCGAPEIPQTLLRQLAVGGRMVVPVGTKTQRMLRITRTAEARFETEDFGDYQFVPMLEGTQAN